LNRLLAVAFPAHEVFSAQGTTGERKITYASESNIKLPPIPTNRAQAAPHDHDYYSHKGDYAITDHGIFIAGIIFDFAPEANIHLIEVLNNEGVGTTQTLVDGLFAIAAKRADYTGSLIINCSLGFAPPQPNEAGKYELKYHDDNGNVVETLTFDSLDALLLPLTTAMNHFYNLMKNVDFQIVAAAGNDGRPDKSPPPAHYPAAYDKVLGVGALENECDTRAWYSNLADLTPDEGVVVFGGEAIPKTSSKRMNGHPVKEWGESSPDSGILGMYLGELPTMDGDGKVVSRTTANGWARWAGTSFACGVMSGILARAALHGCTISLDERAASTNFFNRLYADPSLRRTHHGEAIISAPQGLQGQTAPSTSTTPTTPSTPKKSKWQQILDLIREFFERLIKIINS
jgi:hypothetical protein